MKHKYKITVDEPVPSDEQIARHKDFGRVLANYQNLTQPIYRVPLYKNPKAFMGLVLILVIGALVFWAVEEEENAKAEAEAKTELPAEVRLAEENSFLQAPASAFKVPVTDLQLAQGKPTTLDLPSGARLTVPDKAFIRPDGALPAGPVTLHVRQVSSIAELIAMGLPMAAQDQLIDPTAVLEITATSASVEGPEEVHLFTGQRIAVELPLPANDQAPRNRWQLNARDRAWEGGAQPLTPQARPSRAVGMPHNDGFGVVEYDAEGHVIPKRKPDSDDGKTVNVLQFDVDRLGIVCLGNAVGKPTGTGYKVRFEGPDGQALRILTLYGLTAGRRTVEFLWPKTADFAFDITLTPNLQHSYLGFLPDGRLAYVKQVVAMPDTQPVHVLKMDITPEPVKDISALAQLLDQMAGH